MIIDYAAQNLQMHDLLRKHGVSRDALDPFFRSKLVADLEEYLIAGSEDLLQIDFPNWALKIKGADEAGHLYQYLR